MNLESPPSHAEGNLKVILSLSGYSLEDRLPFALLKLASPRIPFMQLK